MFEDLGRKWRISAALLALALLLVTSACGQAAGPSSSSQGSNSSTAKSGPIKIGVMLPYSGVYTSLGENITRGMELYFDSIGYKVAGKEIVLIKEDTKAEPSVGLQKVRKLVENDKVDLLTGLVHSGVAYALRDYVDSQKIPLIISNAGATDLTRSKGSRYIFRVSFANGQYEYPMGTYAYQKLGYRKVVVMVPDYAAGDEKANAFMQKFKEAGGKIVAVIKPPLGTNDFGPYLSQVKDVDAVWAFFAGSDAVRFVQQYQQYGLKKKYPLIAAGDMVDESFLPAQGDAAIGIVSTLHYSPAIGTPVNREFVEAYKKKYGTVPNQFAEQGYVAARVIVEALKAVNGDTADKEKLLKAIRDVKFEAPQGPFKFLPESQNVIFNVYIRKVEKLPDGTLTNRVIDVIPNVTDRW